MKIKLPKYILFNIFNKLEDIIFATKLGFLPFLNGYELGNLRKFSHHSVDKELYIFEEEKRLFIFYDELVI